MTNRYRLQTPLVDVAEATGSNAEIFEATRQGAGFVPNMYRGMGILPELLSTYTHGYQGFRESGVFTPAEQETVFLTISRLNACGYCTAAPAVLGVKQSGLSQADVDALRDGRPPADGKLAALARFTEVMWESRGNPTPADAKAFRKAGYGDSQILGIVLALAVKTISNYANHLNETPLDDVFAEFAVTEPA